MRTPGVAQRRLTRDAAAQPLRGARLAPALPHQRLIRSATMPLAARPRRPWHAPLSSVHRRRRVSTTRRPSTVRLPIGHFCAPAERGSRWPKDAMPRALTPRSLGWRLLDLDGRAIGSATGHRKPVVHRQNGVVLKTVVHLMRQLSNPGSEVRNLDQYRARCES
jgi:hypothetical protein